VAIPEPDFDADGIPDATDPDDDNDLLPDATELVVGTNQYSADTDGDGVSDGFEYESAYDLNGRPMWSYPAKLPYPNGRDASDVNVDFDGDGMTLIEEYQLWKHTGGKLPLTYSDGDQDSTGTASTADTTPVGSVPNGLALDRLQPNGTLTDDEKDADADGLTNWEETHGPMLISWWGKRYATELQFAGRVGAAPLYETSFVSQDSDGDGNADGTDDQDHDGWSNLDELSRTVSGFWVHVYNPCLPNPDSRTCTLHPPFDDSWAPFGSNAVAGDQADKLVWPR
jgi:hypothetical protein